MGRQGLDAFVERGTPRSCYRRPWLSGTVRIEGRGCSSWHVAPVRICKKKRQKKAPLRVLVVFFEAGAPLRERHSARHGTRAPATRPWGDRCDGHQIMLAAEHGWALLVRWRCYAPPVRAGKGVASSLGLKLGRVRRDSRGGFSGIADESAPTKRVAAACPVGADLSAMGLPNPDKAARDINEVSFRTSPQRGQTSRQS
jgi:hypothetical protein